MAKKKKKGQRTDGLVEVKRKMADGSYKHFYGANKAECEAKYRDALIATAQAKEEQASGPMFVALADEWWEKRERDLSPNTSPRYRRMMQNIVDYFGSYRATEITPSIVTQWLETFAREGKAKKRRLTTKLSCRTFYSMATSDTTCPPIQPGILHCHVG